MYKKKLSQDKDMKKIHSKLLKRISKLTDRSRVSLKQKDNVTMISRKSINSRKSNLSRYTQQNSFKNVSSRTNKTVPIYNDELVKKKRKTRQDLYDINKDIAKEKESLKQIKKSIKNINSKKSVKSKRSFKSKKSLKPKAKSEIVRDSITVNPKRKTKISSSKLIDKELKDLNPIIDEQPNSSKRNFFKKNPADKFEPVNENNFDPFALENKDDKDNFKIDDNFKVEKDFNIEKEDANVKNGVNKEGGEIKSKNESFKTSKKSLEKRNTFDKGEGEGNDFGDDGEGTFGNDSGGKNVFGNSGETDKNNEMDNLDIKNDGKFKKSSNENDYEDFKNADDLKNNNNDDGNKGDLQKDSINENEDLENSDSDDNGKIITSNNLEKSGDNSNEESLKNSELKENSIKKSEVIEEKKKTLVKPPDFLLSNEPALTPENKPENKLRDQTINQSNLNINRDTKLNSLELLDTNSPFESKISEESLNKKISNLKSISEKDRIEEDNLTKKDNIENSDNEISNNNENNNEDLKNKADSVKDEKPKARLKDKSVITHKSIKTERFTNRNSIPHKEELYHSHIGSESLDSENNLEIRESALQKRISKFEEQRKSEIEEKKNSDIEKSNLNELRETRKTNLKLDNSLDIQNKEIEKIRKKTITNSLAKNSLENIENNLEDSRKKSISDNKKNFEDSRLSEINEREKKKNFQLIGPNQNDQEVLLTKEQTRFNSLISENGFQFKNQNLKNKKDLINQPVAIRNKIKTTIEPFEDFKAELDMGGKNTLDLDETIQLGSDRFNNTLNNNGRNSEEGQIKNFFKQKFNK